MKSTTSFDKAKTRLLKTLDNTIMKKSLNNPKKLRSNEPTRKNITVLIKNSELDALEDILFCYLEPKEYEKSLEISKYLWTRLVTVYDEQQEKDNNLDKKYGRIYKALNKESAEMSKEWMSVASKTLPEDSVKIKKAQALELKELKIFAKAQEETLKIH